MYAACMYVCRFLMYILKSMEIHSELSKLSVISQVSTVEGCPLSGVPLYTVCAHTFIVPCYFPLPSIIVSGIGSPIAI